MCWHCCISLRGAVYFGTSVHIFVGLILLLRWILLTYTAGFVTYKLLVDASVLIWTVLSGMYYIFFIALGCLIFAGTERKSVSVLKWSAAGFSVLQVLAFTVILILYLVAPGGWALIDRDVSYEMRVLYVAMFFFALIATANYLVVLFLYIRKLWALKKRTPSLNNIRISHPIAPQPQTVEPRISSTYGVSYHRDRRPQGPESPGIYESLENHSIPSQHQPPFFPANFYASYNSRRNEDGIYSGGSQTSSRGGTYQRAYPYPHQRHREPLTEEEEEWASNYGGQRVHIFQRGQPQRASSATTHPLLQSPHNY